MSSDRDFGSIRQKKKKEVTETLPQWSEIIDSKDIRITQLESMVSQIFKYIQTISIENENLRKMIDDHDVLHLKNEIASLNAEVAWYVADKDRWQDAQAAHLRAIASLKAEVARLREFVLFVDKWTNYKPNKPHQPTSYENCVKTIAPMAAEFRAALTQEKTNET